MTANPSPRSHEPPDYRCPFCRLVSGRADEVLTTDDIVRSAGGATAFISPRWWPNNHGHVLVVPDEHHENLYELPPAAGHGVHDLVREMAVAIRSVYGCHGTSVRQHNEPAGNQDVWHYHVHVFPRYSGDQLYLSKPYPRFVSAAQRRPFADRLRDYFATVPTTGA